MYGEYLGTTVEENARELVVNVIKYECDAFWYIDEWVVEHTERST